MDKIGFQFREGKHFLLCRISDETNIPLATMIAAKDDDSPWELSFSPCIWEHEKEFVWEAASRCEEFHERGVVDIDD